MSDVPISENTALQVIESVCDKLGLVVDWTNQNVVPYAQELAERYIKYIFVSNVVQIVLASVLLVACIVVTYYCYRKNREIVLERGDRWQYNEEVKYLVIGATLACAMPFDVAWLIVKVFQLIKILYIPEVYILNLLANM